MVPGKLPFPRSSRALAADDVARLPDEPKVLGPNDEGSLRMGDEGCPNESSNGDDATGYSKEEEDAYAIACEEVL